MENEEEKDVDEVDNAMKQEEEKVPLPSILRSPWRIVSVQ